MRSPRAIAMGAFLITSEAALCWPSLPDGTVIRLPPAWVVEFEREACDSEFRPRQPRDAWYREVVAGSAEFVTADSYDTEGGMPEVFSRYSHASAERVLGYDPRNAKGFFSSGFPVTGLAQEYAFCPTYHARVLAWAMNKAPASVSVVREEGGVRVYRVDLAPRKQDVAEVEVDMARGTITRVTTWFWRKPEVLTGIIEYDDWKAVESWVYPIRTRIRYPDTLKRGIGDIHMMVTVRSARVAGGDAPPPVRRFPVHATFTSMADNRIYDSKFNVVGEVPAPAQPKPARRWANTALVSAGVVMTALAGWVYARRRRGLS